MRCVIFSDLHMHNFHEFSSIDPLTKLNTRVIDCSSLFRQIFNYCMENEIIKVLFGGDLIHDVLKITPDINYLLSSWLSEFRKNGVRIYAIPGQHDYYNSYVNALLPYKEFIDVFRYSGGIINIGGNIIIHSCFHQPTVEKQKAEFDKIEMITHKRNVLLGHFLVKDLLEKGLYNLDIPCVTYEDLPKGFDLYLLGDYHPHVHIPEKKLVSIGSTHQHTFGSVKRGLGGFLDLDLETLEFKRIELKAPRFIDVEDYRKEDFNDYDFFRVHVKDEKDVKKFERKIKDIDVKYRLVWGNVDTTTEPSREEKEEYLVTMEPEEIIMKYLEKTGRPIKWAEKGKEYL